MKIAGNYLAHIVTLNYLRTGVDLDVKGIASLAGCSASTVRKRIRDNGGELLGCASRYAERHSYNMRGTRVRVWVYGPSRETLRQAVFGAGKHTHDLMRDGAVECATCSREFTPGEQHTYVYLDGKRYPLCFECFAPSN